MISAPEARTSSGRIAFTVAAVPTGMKAGVRISPRFIAMSPVLAGPSLACVTKLKRVIATERLTECVAWAITLCRRHQSRAREFGHGMSSVESFKSLVFIVGAPRCGTTSMWRMLAGHPQGGVPFVKEPHFFSQHDLRGLSDGKLRQTVERDYLRHFFAGRRPGENVGADGSVSYLYPPEQLAPIVRLWPSARFII